MTVVDASGSYSPGFVLGNNQWLGSRLLCENVASRYPLVINYSDRLVRTMAPHLLAAAAPFDVHYAVVYVKHRSPLQFEMHIMSEMVLHIGLCLPRSCSVQEISSLVVRHLNGTETADAPTAAATTSRPRGGAVYGAERAFKVRPDATTEAHGKILGRSEDFKRGTGYKMLK